MDKNENRSNYALCYKPNDNLEKLFIVHKIEKG